MYPVEWPAELRQLAKVAVELKVLEAGGVSGEHLGRMLGDDPPQTVQELELLELRDALPSIRTMIDKTSFQIEEYCSKSGQNFNEVLVTLKTVIDQNVGPLKKENDSFGQVGFDPQP